MALFIEVAEGGLLPTGYGVCWKNYDRRTTTTAPVPLNVLLRSVRSCWYWLRTSYGHEYTIAVLPQQAWLEGHDSGVRVGERAGYARGWEAAMKAMEGELKAWQAARQAEQEEANREFHRTHPPVVYSVTTKPED